MFHIPNGRIFVHYLIDLQDFAPVKLGACSHDLTKDAETSSILAETILDVLNHTAVQCCKS